MKKVLVPLAPGFEEIEAATIIDVLRRAGADVLIAGTVEGSILGSHDVRFDTDTTLDKVRDARFDLVVLPGGMPGATNMAESDHLLHLLQQAERDGRLVAAICAAPLVLAKAGLLSQRRATSYPSFEDRVQPCDYSDDRVVIDRGVITSRGPGTALEFSLALVGVLFGEEKKNELAEGMLFRS